MRTVCNMKIATLFLFIAGALLVGAAQAREISPLLFGQNYWLADEDEGRAGYLHLLWDQVEQSGVQAVRIGGNEYQHNFPPRAKLDAMIDDIRGIGAEPILQVPSTFTALQAAEIVEYYSNPEGRQVQIWSIGNEPFLHGEFTLEEVYEYIVRVGTAMKEVNPDITLYVYDSAWLQMDEYAALFGGELDVTGLRCNGTWLVDGVSFHSYPNGEEFSRDDVALVGPSKIEENFVTLKALLSKCEAMHGRTGEDAFLWGLTELNVTFANPDREISGYGNASFLGGQFIAEVFGYGMKHGATHVNQWCINETDNVTTDFGYIGMSADFYPRSSYYHMQMMSTYMKGVYLDSSDDQKYVKTFATSDGGDRIAVLVMNQELERDLKFGISLSGKSLKGVDCAIAVEAGLSGDYRGVIPAQCSQVLVFDASGQFVEGLSYGIEQNLKYAAPVALEP